MTIYCPLSDYYSPCEKTECAWYNTDTKTCFWPDEIKRIRKALESIANSISNGVKK